ncbi:hypothetical protein [Ruegeria sp.]|uniref:hypothetical protein n=1 Tax=Ruegeria sp. TaxID=1879320 RepID=UPI003B5A54DE
MADKLWAGLIACAALVVGVLVFAAIGTPMGHSFGFNLSWTIAFSEAVGLGTPYPRFLPALWDGIGGFDFFFYAPLPFYVAAGPAQWLCPECSPQVQFGLAGGLLCWLSGLAFWVFARQFLPMKSAAIAAVVWALAPYHLGIDWVVRQAAGEFAGYVFVPLVCHGVCLALRDHRAAWSLPVGLAGLGFCHLPTLLLVAHVLAIVVVARLLVQRARVVPALLVLTVMGSAGLAISALYWLPALVLLGDVSPQGLYTPELVPAHWFLIGVDTLPDSRFRLALLLCQAAACILAVLAVVASRGDNRRQLIIWALLPAWLVLGLNSTLSEALWNNWIIARVQFPYRLTVMSDLALALSAGAISSALMSGQCARRWAIFAAVCLLIPWAAVASLVPDRIARGIAARGQPVAMIGAPEYLPPAVFDPLAEQTRTAGDPIWAVPQHFLNVVDKIQTPALGFAKPIPEGPRQWLLPASASAQDQPQRVALMYWTHMRAETAEGLPVTLSPDPQTGLLRVDPTATDVKILLPLHWSEKAGAVLTVIGLFVALIYGFRARRRGTGSGIS